MGKRPRKVRCPDGTVKFVHSSADDAFPLHLSQADGQLKATVNALDQAEVSIEGGFKRSISGMLFAINQKTDSLMMSFRGLYAIYQADPCANSERFASGVERLVHEQTRLTEVTVRLQALISLIQVNGGESETMLRYLIEIVQQLGSVPPEVTRELTTLAIARNVDAADEWIDRAPNRVDDPANEQRQRRPEAQGDSL